MAPGRGMSISTRATTARRTSLSTSRTSIMAALSRRSAGQEAQGSGSALRRLPGPRRLPPPAAPRALRPRDRADLLGDEIERKEHGPILELVWRLVRQQGNDLFAGHEVEPQRLGLVAGHALPSRRPMIRACWRQ